MESIQLSFTGKGSEYAKLWLSNLLLTILTLGFYGPWAKVRAQKYLLGHTSLDGATFDYIADPKKILKGRIIVIVFFMFYSAVVNIFPMIAPFGGLVLLAIAPAIVLKSLQFKARYTTYRNLSFHFMGSLGQIFLWLVVMPVLSLLSLGLAYPWVKYKQRQYLVNNVRYGRAAFEFGGALKSFYIAYLCGLALFILPVGVFIVRSVLDTFFPESDDNSLLSLLTGNLGALAMIGGAVLFYVVGPALVRAILARETWNGLKCGRFIVSVDATIPELLKLVSTNGAMILFTLGLAMPFATIRTRKFLAAHTTVHGPKDFAAFTDEQRSEIRALGSEAADVYDVDIDFGF